MFSVQTVIKMKRLIIFSLCICLTKIVVDASNSGEDTYKIHFNEDFFDEDVEIPALEDRFLGEKTIKSLLQKKKQILGEIARYVSFKKETDGLDTNRTFFEGAKESFKRHMAIIFPGTRWCGAGDKARYFEDLGHFDRPDRCCREHDMCDEIMLKGESKYGLNNTGLFTRSHCSCDIKFYNCLKEARTIVSKEIGHTYFTFLAPQCFKEEYPVKGCIQYSRGKCLEYRFNTLATKTYQWFDSPMF